MNFGEYVAGEEYAPNLVAKVLPVVDVASKQVYYYSAENLGKVGDPIGITLPYSANINFDVSLAKRAKLTLNGNATFSFSNLRAWDCGIIVVTMGGDGNHTINWGAAKLPIGGLNLSANINELTQIGFLYDGTNLMLTHLNYGTASVPSVGDTTPPVVVGFAISVTNKIYMTVSETSNVTTAGFSFIKNDVNWQILGVESLGGSVYAFTMNGNAIPGDVVLASYSAAIGSTADLAGNRMASFYVVEVENTLTSLPALSAPELVATPSGAARIDVSWTPSPGAIAYALVRSSDGQSGFTQIGGVISAATTNYLDTAVISGEQWFYKIKAIANGTSNSDSPYSNVDGAIAGGAGDVTAPVRVSIRVEDTSKDRIDLKYDENLLGSSIPSSSAFTVSGGKTIVGLEILADTLRIFVNTPYAYGDNITLAYTQPGSNRIKDLAGNDAPSFTTTAVTNAISPSTTYLTWQTLASAHEQINSNQGLRKKSGSGNSWEWVGAVSVSNQTIGEGERVIWQVDGVTVLNLMVGLAGSSATDIRNAAGSSFGIAVDWYSGAIGRENASNVGSVVPFGSLPDGSLLSIFYENATTVKYQYSTNGGTSWTTFHTSANDPSGVYNVQVMIYEELKSTVKIYKA